MKQTIKRYGELKKLISQGHTVTLDGRAMNNDKVNAMRMIEVQTAIKDEQFKVEAIEGEFIGKDDKPKSNEYRYDPRDQAIHAQMQMAQVQAQAQSAMNMYGNSSSLGGLRSGMVAAGIGSLFGGI